MRSFLDFASSVSFAVAAVIWAMRDYLAVSILCIICSLVMQYKLLYMNKRD